MLAAACSGTPQPSTADPYAAEIKRAQAEATSDFERAVLADGRIAREEYLEAVQRMVQCAQARGVTITVSETDGDVRYESSGPDALRVFDECSVGTTQIIEALYSDMLMNPDNEDIFEIQAACLRRIGLAPVSFNGKEFEKAIKGGKTTQDQLPFKLDDERVRQCLSHPKGR